MIEGAYYKNLLGHLIGPMCKRGIQIKVGNEWFDSWESINHKFIFFTGGSIYNDSVEYNIDTNKPFDKYGNPFETCGTLESQNPATKAFIKTINEHMEEILPPQQIGQLDEFTGHLNTIIDGMRYTLGTKAKEYSHNGNRFYNFDEAAKNLPSGNPREALYGMMLKHWISVQDLVLGRLNDSFASEKIGDMRNYLTLLEIMIKMRPKT